jgi:hypothetical protein
MNRLTTFLKCDVYGVEAEKRREEKRREEKRREEGTLSIHPTAKAEEVPVLPQLYIIIMYLLPFCGKEAA